MLHQFVRPCRPLPYMSVEYRNTPPRPRLAFLFALQRYLPQEPASHTHIHTHEPTPLPYVFDRFKVFVVVSVIVVVIV